MRAWGPSTGPTACALAGRRCSLWGWRKGISGGGAFHHCEGRLRSGAVPPPTARPLGGLLGSATHVLWARVCGCGGPTLSPWPACPVGAACRGGGGGPSPGGGGLPPLRGTSGVRRCPCPGRPSSGAGSRGAATRVSRVSRDTSRDRSRRKKENQEKDAPAEKIRQKIVFSDLRNPPKNFTPLFGEVAKFRTPTKKNNRVATAKKLSVACPKPPGKVRALGARDLCAPQNKTHINNNNATDRRKTSMLYAAQR